MTHLILVLRSFDKQEIENDHTGRLYDLIYLWDCTSSYTMKTNECSFQKHELVVCTLEIKSLWQLQISRLCVDSKLSRNDERESCEIRRKFRGWNSVAVIQTWGVFLVSVFSFRCFGVRIQEHHERHFVITTMCTSKGLKSETVEQPTVPAEGRRSWQLRDGWKFDSCDNWERWTLRIFPVGVFCFGSAKFLLAICCEHLLRWSLASSDNESETNDSFLKMQQTKIKCPFN